MWKINQFIITILTTLQYIFQNFVLHFNYKYRKIGQTLRYVRAEYKKQSLYTNSDSHFFH